MRAARGILWDLSDRRGIGDALLEADDDVRIELVESLVAIIKVAALQVVDHCKPSKLQWDNRVWPHTAHGKDNGKYFINIDSDGLFCAYRRQADGTIDIAFVKGKISTCAAAHQYCQTHFERSIL